MGAPFGWAPSLLPDDGWAYADNPIGTSTTRPQQWMSNATPIDPVATTVGGEPVTRGQMRDMARSAWQTAMSVSDGGLAAPGMMGAIKAYHGSPHSFDRFDMSKIGTGEGAQAYGHGLYFAGNEGVARAYRDALSGANVDARNFMRDGQIVPDLGAVWQQSYDAAKGTRAMRPDDARAIAGHVRRWVEAGKKPETYLRFNVPPAGYEAAYEAAVQPWLGVSYKKNPGHMYEVSLNVEPRQLLDWDKPLAGQSAARNLPEAFQNTDEAAGAGDDGRHPGLSRFAARLSCGCAGYLPRRARAHGGSATDETRPGLG